MDRFVRDELSPAEARELAQASLDSPELFAELTDSALAKGALYSGTLRMGGGAADSKVRRFPRTSWFVIAGVAAAAVVVSITVALLKPGQTRNAGLEPALALTGHGEPVLLASGLQPAPGNLDHAPVFRGPETDSRAPQTTGSIVSLEEDLATVNLGSLDGLAKGSELRIFHDDQSNVAVGRFEVTTVFREHARGRIVDGQKVGVKDRVRVDDAAHLDALLQQVDAMYNRGDAEAAYQAAKQAGQWVVSTDVPPARQSELWNQLAVLGMLRGDYRDAEAQLSRAVAGSPKSGLTYAECMNNLGVLAEMRGDRRTSKSRYADALQALAGIPDPPQQERRTIEGNLARLEGRR